MSMRLLKIQVGWCLITIGGTILVYVTEKGSHDQVLEALAFLFCAIILNVVYLAAWFLIRFWRKIRLANRTGDNGKV